MGNTAELLLEDLLSQSQLLKIQNAEMPTTGVLLPRMVDPKPPSMTGDSDELVLVPEEQRGTSDSLKIELEVRILSNTLFK